MGTWGYGIYEDDMAEDTKEDYLRQLKLGKSDEDALHDFLESYAKDLEDEEDSAVIYLALADTMWKKGRLTQEIKDKAFEAMVRDLELGRWESEKDIRNRTKVLDKLKEKLNSPMPARKKIPVHKPYKLDMKEHDLYYYQIQSFDRHPEYKEHVGKYIIMYVDEIFEDDWKVRGIFDELAYIYFFVTDSKPEDVSCLDNAIEIQKRFYLCEASKRERPKDFTYLGNRDLDKFKPRYKGRFFSWGGPELAYRDIILQMKWENGYSDTIKNATSIMNESEDEIIYINENSGKVIVVSSDGEYLMNTDIEGLNRYLKTIKKEG